MIIVKPQGRLGNMLFQLASGHAHARKTDTQLFVLDCSEDYQKYKYNLFGNFQTINYVPHDAIIYKEPKFSYTPIPVWLYKNMVLDGYFQSDKYFDGWLNPFLLKLNSPIDSCKVLEKFDKNKHYCFVHIRRGDYLNLQNYHPTVTLDYIRRGMNEVESKHGKVEYVIFSDDMAWVKSHIIGDNVTYWEFKKDSNFPDEIYDLAAMSCCQSAIIANSSYSWWGAKTGNMQTVVAPAQWFGPNGPQDWQDVYCKDWIVI